MARLERTTRRTDINESDFVNFYPYPPHYIDLFIGIMSGIRLQPGAPRHYGGSNRTIIKQAYEMQCQIGRHLPKKPIGALVTLDKVFELVEGNLSNEKRTDIHQISERFKNDPEDRGWALRVANAICLLEFIRDLPRTESNLSAVLVDEVGKATPLSEVQAAVKRLDAAKFIRNTEEGWKLQTAQEKNWTNECSGHLDPKPRERNELTRTALQQIIDEPEFKTFRYQNRTFRVGISVDGMSIGDEGELPLTLCVAEDKSSVWTLTFLGFHLNKSEDGGVAVAISCRTKGRMDSRIRELTPRTWGQSLSARAFERLNGYLRGWIGYFRLCTEDRLSPLHKFDAHIRRRLRAIIIRQKKRPRHHLSPSDCVQRLSAVGGSYRLSAYRCLAAQCQFRHP